MFYPDQKDALLQVLEKASGSLEGIDKLDALLKPKVYFCYVKYFLGKGHHLEMEVRPFKLSTESLIMTDEEIETAVATIKADEHLLRSVQFMEIILGYYLRDLKSLLGKRFAGLYNALDTYISEANKGNMTSELLPYLVAFNAGRKWNLPDASFVRIGLKEIFDEGRFVHNDMCPFGKRAKQLLGGGIENPTGLVAIVYQTIQSGEDARAITRDSMIPVASQ